MPLALTLTSNFPCVQEEERWGDVSNDEDDTKEKTLPEDPETCLQLNMVYQEVVQEKLAEVSLLLAQNREQQVGRGRPREPPGQASQNQGSGGACSPAARVPVSTSRATAAWPQRGPMCLHRRVSCGIWQDPKAPR